MTKTIAPTWKGSTTPTRAWVIGIMAIRRVIIGVAITGIMVGAVYMAMALIGAGDLVGALAVFTTPGIAHGAFMAGDTAVAGDLDMAGDMAMVGVTDTKAMAVVAK